MPKETSQWGLLPIGPARMPKDAMHVCALTQNGALTDGRRLRVLFRQTWPIAPRGYCQQQRRVPNYKSYSDSYF